MPINPDVIVFDVNETLSDMSPMAEKFVEVGAPASLAKLWFATLLRDGFALTAAGDNAVFAEVGAEVLRGLLPAFQPKMGVEEAVKHIIGGMGDLDVHGDVPDGVRNLSEAGYRLITLTNGATKLAERLFDSAAIRDRFESLLSVQDAPVWKPARESYEYAASVCGVPVERMMLVAVHPWDIHGAARAGLSTAWINRNAAPYPSYFDAPTHTITGLGELPGALGKVR